MSDTASSSALIDGHVGAGPKAAVFAFVWALACLATAMAIFGLVLLVSDQNEREAGRTIVSAQKGAGYADMLVTGFAARQGRSDRGF